METRKKINVFFLSSDISSLVKMRDREMMTPAVPGRLTDTERVRMGVETKSCKNRSSGLCANILLTFSSHHSLSVPLGQHPHVTIETGLLHWGGRY